MQSDKKGGQIVFINDYVGLLLHFLSLNEFNPVGGYFKTLLKSNARTQK